MSLKRQAQRYGKWLAVIFVFAGIATFAGAYILIQQRLKLPFQDRYTMYVDFANASGLTPGLGQPVNVAGVKVGTVEGVSLKQGRAHVEIAINPKKLDAVHEGAGATLEPRTPLKDLQLDLNPGPITAPKLREGATIPSARTSYPIDADELLSVLDSDTREYFRALLATAEQGLDGRGKDVRRLLKALGPTSDQINDITGLIVKRRTKVERLVHNLAVLAKATGTHDRQLSAALADGATTLTALGGQDAELRRSLQKLPSTLSAARDALPEIKGLADDLGPTLKALQPSLRALPAALRSAAALAERSVPLLRDQLRPLARETIGPGKRLSRATTTLSKITPALISAFRTLVYVTNESAYNPPGNDDEGYLFWLAWTAHNAASLFTFQDANGATWRAPTLVGCNSITEGSGAALAPLLAVTGLLPVCGGTTPIK